MTVNPFEREIRTEELDATEMTFSGSNAYGIDREPDHLAGRDNRWRGAPGLQVWVREQRRCGCSASGGVGATRETRRPASKNAEYVDALRYFRMR